ncbi:hypothetical protein, partial [Bacteroides pyogenes]|uniref:hypothetical protein n=1 Tax=Bacteroides pyogenes TaxID=310300 RepID=UPI001BA4A305
STDHTPAVRRNVYFYPWLYFFVWQLKDNQKGWYLVRSVSPKFYTTEEVLPDSNNKKSMKS